MFKEIPKQEPTPEEITTLRIRVEGLVQGVGFRAFAVKEATALGLMGWVRNRSDGTVEVLASGLTNRVEDLLQAFLTRPPAAARIENIDMLTADAPTQPGFAQRASL